MSVTTDEAREVEGRIRTVAGDGLVLVDARGAVRRFSREQIATVRVGPRWGAGTWTLFGALLGAAAGAAVASGAGPDWHDAPITPGLAYGAWGGFVGVAVGAAIGGSLNARPWPVVYERPSSRTATIDLRPVLATDRTAVYLTVGF